MEHKVWLITGTSKGFGRIWAEAALQRGDKVAATARNIDTLSALTAKYGDAVLPISLDVNNREACFEAAKKTQEHFGKIDILVSNAGFGHFGCIEEISEAEAREQIETNVFGSLWVIQAVLPIMRAQQSGHIMQVSSIGGVTTFPTLGIYHASKWAVEGICDSLAQEVAGFGIKVTLIEPAGYATEWGTASAKQSQAIEAYTGVKTALYQAFSGVPQGNPANTASAILTLADTENPPLRLFLGAVPLHVIEPVYAKRLAEWKAWQTVAESAQ